MSAHDSKEMRPLPLEAGERGLASEHVVHRLGAAPVGVWTAKKTRQAAIPSSALL